MRVSIKLLTTDPYDSKSSKEKQIHNLKNHLIFQLRPKYLKFMVWTAGSPNPNLAPGICDVQIRDAANTTWVIDLENQVLTYPVLLSATVTQNNVTCYAAKNGTATTVQGGAGRYSYLWSDGQTLQTITGLAPGN